MLNRVSDCFLQTSQLANEHHVLSRGRFNIVVSLKFIIPWRYIMCMNVRGGGRLKMFPCGLKKNKTRSIERKKS